MFLFLTFFAEELKINTANLLVGKRPQDLLEAHSRSHNMTGSMVFDILSSQFLNKTVKNNIYEKNIHT